MARSRLWSLELGTCLAIVAVTLAADCPTSQVPARRQGNPITVSTPDIVNGCVCAPGWSSSKELQDAGRISNNLAFQCFVCPAGKFCAGSNRLESCPKGSTSGPGSFSAMQCMCTANHERSGQTTPLCTDVSSAPFTADVAKKLGQSASSVAFAIFIFCVLVQAACLLYEARGYQVQGGLNTNIGPAFLVGHVQYITILRNLGGLSAAPTSLHAFVDPFSWAILDTGGLNINMVKGSISPADLCHQSWGNPLLERIVIFLAVILLIMVARLSTALIFSSSDKKFVSRYMRVLSWEGPVLACIFFGLFDGAATVAGQREGIFCTGWTFIGWSIAVLTLAVWLGLLTNKIRKQIGLRHLFYIGPPSVPLNLLIETFTKDGVDLNGNNLSFTARMAEAVKLFQGHRAGSVHGGWNGEGAGLPLVNCVRCYNESSWAFFFIPLIKGVMLTNLVTLVSGDATRGIAAGTSIFHLIILVVVQPYIRLSDNIRSLAMCCTEIIIVIASSFAGTDRHIQSVTATIIICFITTLVVSFSCALHSLHLIQLIKSADWAEPGPEYEVRPSRRTSMVSLQLSAERFSRLGSESRSNEDSRASSAFASARHHRAQPNKADAHPQPQVRQLNAPPAPSHEEANNGGGNQGGSENVRDRDNEGGGWDRDNEGGGWDRDNDRGVRDRDNEGGGWDRDKDRGVRDRDNEGGGWDPDNDRGVRDRDNGRRIRRLGDRGYGGGIEFVPEKNLPPKNGRRTSQVVSVGGDMPGDMSCNLVYVAGSAHARNDSDVMEIGRWGASRRPITTEALDDAQHLVGGEAKILVVGSSGDEAGTSDVDAAVDDEAKAKILPGTLMGTSVLHGHWRTMEMSSAAGGDASGKSAPYALQAERAGQLQPSTPKSLSSKPPAYTEAAAAPSSANGASPTQETYAERMRRLADESTTSESESESESESGLGSPYTDATSVAKNMNLGPAARGPAVPSTQAIIGMEDAGNKTQEIRPQFFA